MNPGLALSPMSLCFACRRCPSSCPPSLSVGWGGRHQEFCWLQFQGQLYLVCRPCFQAAEIRRILGTAGRQPDAWGPAYVRICRSLETTYDLAYTLAVNAAEAEARREAQAQREGEGEGETLAQAQASAAASARPTLGSAPPMGPAGRGRSQSRGTGRRGGAGRGRGGRGTGGEGRRSRSRP